MSPDAAMAPLQAPKAVAPAPGMEGFAIGMTRFTKNIENIKPMDTPFQFVTLKKQSLLQKLFRQNPEENALITLNNQLFNEGLQGMTSEKFKNLEATYSISIKERFGLNLEEFYAVAFNHCLSNYILSEQESSNLKNLAQVLGLTQQTTDFLHIEIGKTAYRKCFIQTLSNGDFNAEKEEYLKTIQKNLRLPDQVEKIISEEVRSQHLLDYFNKMVSDQRVSPQEEEVFNRKAKSLKINPVSNTQTQHQLKQYRQYWSLENEALTAIENIFEIQKSETCYMVVNRVQIYEPRSDRSKYGGTYEKLIDSGTLYLTQKRIFIIGLEKNYTIKLESIVRAQKTTDGITIHKLNGRNPTLQMSTHEITIISILLKKLGIYRN
ncbi:MAG: hypothetical protein EOO20_21515 [Chryseobacterium sp.]|nr:MAG: hypothetical protein EOO20_21515 [Chryseobacterium sp.]